LTSSLLARKGEAEPAIEPYSFLDSNDGGANSPPRDSAGPDGGGRINGSADPSGPTAVMNMNSADETGDGASTTDGGRGPAGADDGGGGAGEDKSEAVRDRRLLRFVYVTAALTGILAIVLYAGDWMFNSSAPDVKQAEAPAATEKAQPDSAPAQESTVAGTNGRKRVTRLKLSEPPAPPAPVSPPQNAPAVETAVPKSPPPKAVESMGSGETAAETMKSTLPVAPGGETPAAKPEAPSMAMPVEKPVAPAAEAPAPPPPASPEPATSTAATEKTVPAPPPAKPEAATPEPPAESPAPATATTKKKPSTVASAPATASSAPKVSASGRYLVQLGSVTSEAGARRFWGKVQKKFPGILGGYDMIMEKRTIAKRGTFYRVQVGRFATIKEARGLCDALKKRKQGCLPIKR
jgi:hypothetical protein